MVGGAPSGTRPFRGWLIPLCVCFRASSWHWREANDDGGRQRRRRRRRALLRGRSDALLAQVRQLRESMQQESGVLQQKAQASEQERTSSRLRSETWDARCLDRGRRGKHAVPDGRRRKRSVADAELQPAPAAIGGARSVADGADGPSDANSQIEAELARRRGAAGAAQAQAQPPRGHGASSSPPPARPSPPAARQPGADAKGGKAPRFATKPGGAEAARADHISKVRGAPAVQGTAGAASDIFSR